MLLLSGGLDSVVNCAIAMREAPVLLALTFDYGQHALQREIDAAKAVCDHYSIRHRVIPLPWLKEITCSDLVRDGARPPELRKEDLDDPVKTKDSARAVWVPNRNGIMIEIAAAFAEVMGAGRIIVGFNREEASTFPDNSETYLAAVNRSLAYSAGAPMEVVSYTVGMDKKEIVRAGLQHQVPLGKIWSCYRGEEKMCGSCESCGRLKRAISGTEAEKILRGFLPG
ncbi:MAG: 7-cyano-7-deazaguanine synthase QueC [Deltaproteobacteria bacterium]|nr:7-cyano-7-deazaguanine synthase QueC [Deltaproteobacteria bacterium]